MEDKNVKTIDFLRARLLAERSVSRTARQRAYELAKRVTELEKQLKFVTLQRKKAEKATVDVLAILENHGRNDNDLSEPFDSSSDQEEVSSDYKNGKLPEASENEKLPESDMEGFSESSSANGRSLSWKSSKNSSSRYLEKKYMDASRRRRSNSFTSTGSSPRRVGKSCRQIRHKEHRSAADGSQKDDVANGHHEDERRTSSEGVQTSADVATDALLEEHNIHEDKDPVCASTSLYNGHAVKTHGTERDMERALEHQAQFIAQYEAEEKAQRDWEDKFRENNGSPPDSCDPGTHSDVTEERDEIKPPAPTPNPDPPSSNDQITPESQQVNTTVPDTNFIEKPKTESQPSDHNTTETHNNKEPDNQNPPPYSNDKITPSNFIPHEQTHENPNNLTSVLEALQQAKLSLKQNINIIPLLENSKPSIPNYRPSEKFPVPVSSVGLFRLPTDYEYEPPTTNRVNPLTNRVNSLTYDSRLSLTNYPTDPSLSRSTASLDNRFSVVPNFPYQETRSEITRIPPATFPYQEIRSEITRIPPANFPYQETRSEITRIPSANFSYQETRSEITRIPPAGYNPRFDMVPPAGLDPRLEMGMGMGRSGFDPRMEMGDGYMRSSDRSQSRPGANLPLRTRSLYDDYTRPNTYG